MNIFQSSSNLLPQDDYLSEIHKCVRDEMVKASSEQHTRHRELDVLFRVVKSIIRSTITSCFFFPFFSCFLNISSSLLVCTYLQVVSFTYHNASSFLHVSERRFRYSFSAREFHNISSQVLLVVN